MKHNLEIKCRLDNLSGVRKLLKESRSFKYSVEKQNDIYFKVKKGRLKLRIINNKTGNLIYYFRNEKSSEMKSGYIISATENFKELFKILSNQFEIFVTVKKKREIFVKDNIRIHLDNVTELGKFMEIEIIYKNLGSAKVRMKEILNFIKPEIRSYINKSYSDLLIK